ncbi:MAG: hypothetical protein JHD07_14000 [Bradyrhizobium sp.]|uniref:hypothetical protein n=1 Tax=Bradyrhizobium sp. TaxID=376 RepID=UPI001A2AE346|nr:hypothetical protein [Bradyrhizobium sp.]MBJ7404340.1 hypothetical protein [Bradyrhizobium sp.]
MSASRRVKIIIPMVSAISLLALPAQAQDARPRSEASQPQARPAAGPPPQSDQNVRRGPSPQQAARPAPQPGAQPRAGGPGPHQAGGPPPGRHYARGPAPERNWGGHAYRGNRAWDGGRWRHEVRNGRSGWWWDVGGVWYYYPQRMAGPPAYISEDYIDDMPVAYAPPVTYAPPPPPPQPADPGVSALGGAIVGGVLGGLISGNATGAAAGAVLGGATGAIAGATAASQPGYYWAQGTCYYRYPNGQYVQADPRACY